MLCFFLYVALGVTVSPHLVQGSSSPESFHSSTPTQSYGRPNHADSFSRESSPDTLSLQEKGILLRPTANLRQKDVVDEAAEELENFAEPTGELVSSGLSTSHVKEEAAAESPVPTVHSEKEGVLSQSENASQAPTPNVIADEEVFVPLRKWKEKKLQDMETLVKKEALLASARSRRLLRLKQLERTRFYALMPLQAFSRPMCRLVQRQRSEQLRHRLSPEIRPELSGNEVPEKMEDARTEDRKDVEIFGGDTFVELTGGSNNHRTGHEVPSQEADKTMTDAQVKLEKVSSGLRASDDKPEETAKLNRDTDISKGMGRLSEQTDLGRSTRGKERNASSDTNTRKAITRERRGKRGTSSRLKKHKRDAKVQPGELFNYASVDAGARLLGHSRQAVGAKNIINENKDKYMLVPCEADGPSGSRWVDLELKEEIYIQSIQIGNFEFYSSNTRKVAVLAASKKYPPEKWSTLGIFIMEDSLGIQRFEMSRSSIARYLRLLFVGKQGNEYYCPISVVRVFGKATFEDWREEFEQENQEQRTGGADTEFVHGAEDVTLLGEGITGEINDVEGFGAGDIHRNSDSELPPTGADKSPHAESRSEFERSSGENDPSEDGEPSVPPEKTSVDKEMRNEDRKFGDASLTVKEKSAIRNGTSSADQEVELSNLSEEEKLVLKAVRDAATAPESRDESIFRKISRVIRLIEVNQSLTNQYIDTHLERYAVKLTRVREEAHVAKRSAEELRVQLNLLAHSSQRSLERLANTTFKRDVIIVVLLILNVFLVAGYAVIVWTSFSGSQLRMRGDSRKFSSSPDFEAESGARLEDLLPPSLATSVLKGSFKVKKEGSTMTLDDNTSSNGARSNTRNVACMDELNQRTVSDGEPGPVLARVRSNARRRKKRSKHAKGGRDRDQNRFKVLNHDT